MTTHRGLAGVGRPADEVDGLVPQRQEVVDSSAHPSGLVAPHGRESAARRTGHDNRRAWRHLELVKSIELKTLDDETVDPPRHPLHGVPVGPDEVIGGLQTVQDDGEITTPGGVDDGLNSAQLAGARKIRGKDANGTRAPRAEAASGEIGRVPHLGHGLENLLDGLRSDRVRVIDDA